ncbi:hypothetical protein [Mycobacterium sp. NAZ190054]|uniref:hypothetical protein n=1 Tax=Mycobacterium sp. NAZ190054 TaxID=1747766 RepID=UPI0012E35CC8|nr:hypothetical protein [Mycobacterium sp. NAZ190054]
MFAIAAGSSVLTAIVTVVGNGIFGWAKGRAETDNTDADTAAIFNKISADLALRDAERAKRDDLRIRTLVSAIEKLTDAVDRVATAPLLQRIARDSDDAEVVDFHNRLAEMRESNRHARLAI